MIYVEDKFIYLCNPRTGSRSTSWALRDHCGGVRLINQHHAMKYHLDSLLSNYDVPVYMTIRDPYDMVLSHYSRHGKSSRDLAEFIREWNPWASTVFREFPHRSLFLYRDYADHCFLFEFGLKDILRRMGFPDVEPAMMGTNETPPYHPIGACPPEYKRIIEDAYAEDIAFYNLWKDKQDRMAA